MIRIDREIYFKHIVIDLEIPNESSSIEFPILGNYSCDSDFDNFSPHLSDIPPTQKYEMTFQVDLLEVAEENILCQDSPTRVRDKEN
jgi:hypothetical protein